MSGDKNIADLGTILTVWAHPDDETYLAGGIMAAAAANGQRVVCITATKGGAGKTDLPAETELTDVRERELEDALAVLGVSERGWLDCDDGRCDQITAEDGSARILALLEYIQPDTILTFGPDGWSGHPDHKSVARWTASAFRHWDNPKARLYRLVVSPDWAAKFGPESVENIYYNATGPAVCAEADMAIRYELSPEIWEKKLVAIRAHASQAANIEQSFGVDFYKLENQTECFCLVADRIS